MTPPHFSDLYVTQRYNRALHFVQNLPATSNFQPNKNQKLELYALYKQVSVGDIDLPRPGLFDVVGRAKWDAWKKLEGTSILEARHMYVEALLRIAAEAYKKNVGREEAQKILHTFANMEPSTEEDSDLTDDTSNQEDDDSSIGSEDTEEKAYLRDIEENEITPFVVPDNPVLTYESPDHLNTQRMQNTLPARSQPYHPPPPPPSSQKSYRNRPESVASVQTMVTAPTTPRQNPIHRPPSTTNTSVISGRSNTSSRVGHYRTNDKSNKDEVRGLQSKLPVHEEYVDVNVNPWQQVPTQRNYGSGYNSSSEDSIENRTPSRLLRRHPSNTSIGLLSAHQQHQIQQLQQLQQQQTRRKSSTSPSYPPSMTPMNQSYLSPILGSSASSSVITTTPHNHDPNRLTSYPLDSSRPYTATVALGPATKKALESLQNEVIALNDRIDELRKELVERDKNKSSHTSSSTAVTDSSDDPREKWKGLIKAALRYAGVHFMTAIVIFLILYKMRSPVAYAILRSLRNADKTIT